MNYRCLGQSGLIVSELCLGTMIFGEDSPRATDEPTAIRIIHHFLEAGGNHIDTANVYAGGRSEEIVGRAIRDKRQQVVLATKVRFAIGDGPNDQGLSRLHIQRSVEASLRRLQTDTIDLLYMHCWDPITPIEESLRACDDLITAGKVRYIGVSNFKAWQLMKALAVSGRQGYARFIAAQYQYSLVERGIEAEFNELCLAEGVGITPWGPLGGGFLSGKYKPGKRPTLPEEGRLATQPESDEEAWTRRAVERNWRILATLDEVAKAHPDSSYSQVALAWLLAQPAVASLVIGVRTQEQLEDNLAASTMHLTPDEITCLSAASQPEPGYPYRFITSFGKRDF